MTCSLRQHRRAEAWQVVYIARVNVCYWKAVLAKRRRQSMTLRCALPLLVFTLTISPVVSPIAWNPALLAASLTLAASLGREFLVSARTTRLKNYCRQWSELLHDAELLWREGDDLGWGQRHLAAQIERLSARMRSFQADELESPNTQILVNCERELYKGLGLPFPAHEGPADA
jgi:hypothetical protein